MNIQTTDARGLFTKALADVYVEKISPMSFLRSFFPAKEHFTKEISIEVQRGTEKIAVDVLRGTEGNRNIVSRSTEKIFIPPYFREYIDATELSLYDRVLGSTNIDSGAFSALLERVTEEMLMLQYNIEASYELQCAQVLETGIVTLKSGNNIDFKRKAASKVDLGVGNYWAVGTTDPYQSLENGAIFLRTTGKSRGAVINVIMGSQALNDFLNNDTVKERADIRNFSLDAVRAPQKNSVGAALHGMVSAGSYSFAIWSYPEYYDDALGVSTPYIDPKNVIILPENPRFNFSYAAVPQLLTKNAPKRGAFVLGDYVDERNDKHVFDVKSAGLPIPVAVDQIYTVQVVA